MPLDIRSRVKSAKAQLVISFCILVLLKALLSLRFHSPWIFPDEVSYAQMAADIFGSTHLSLPRVYPFIISIAYQFSANKVIIYHIILLINCILSSLAIFPSYFILMRYCPKDFSLMGAITIATLPSLTLYTFVIMTENLFIPLFLFSIWFLLEAYEKEKPLWIVLAISSALLLFIARHNGILALAAMAISLIYYLIFSMRSNDIRQRLSDRTSIIILIILSIASLASIGLIIAGSGHNSYLGWLRDRITTDSQIFLDLFTNINNLMEYVILLQKEIAYLMLGSYFIFFYITIILLLVMYLRRVRAGECTIISCRPNSLGKEDLAIESVGIYLLATSATLLLLTAMSAYKSEQEVYGRYIDPIIPGLFIFGLIGLYHMYQASEKPKIWMLAIVGIALSIIFFYNFPILKAEEFPILYVNPLRNLAPNWIVFPALSAGFFLLLGLYKKLKDNWRIFFVIIIAFSACISAYSYYADLLYQSDRYHAMNQIGIYLNENSSQNSKILMDAEIPGEDWFFQNLIMFWAKRSPEYVLVNDDLLSGLEGEKEEVLLITSKALPLEPLTYSTRGYYLYKFI